MLNLKIVKFIAMKTKTLPLICAFIFALSNIVIAQEDDDWVTSRPSNESSETQTENTYDGSNDAEFANDEEYAAAYAKYKNEATSKAEINRQRTEGFARAFMLGIRGQGGTNTFFGTHSEGWTLGWQVGGGLIVKMPLGIKDLSVVPELTFNFRQYRYNEDTDYGTNDATIDIMMFEIPIMFRYTFEDNNIFVGLGLNIGLKLMGSSEFNMNVDIGEDKTYDNKIATSSVEVGGALDLGYMLSRYVHLNIRIVQCFTSLLNQTLVAQKEFLDSSLLTFNATFGATIFF